MVSQRVTFTANGAICEGVFARPDEIPRAPGLAICHPHPLHGGDMENNVVRGLALAFEAAGFAVLRFNFRGVGRSTGRYGQGLAEQEDAKAALTCLASQPGVDADRLLLAGYSFGARVTLAVASADARVGGFVAVAPPALHGEWPSMVASRGPKIFLCGGRDPYAPPEVLAGLANDLPEPKRLVVIPDADHFFAGQERALAHLAVKLMQELSEAHS